MPDEHQPEEMVSNQAPEADLASSLQEQPPVVRGPGATPRAAVCYGEQSKSIWGILLPNQAISSLEWSPLGAGVEATIG